MSMAAESELSIGEVVLVSLRSIVTILVIYAFGIIFSRSLNKIDRAGLKTVSAVAATLFSSCFYIARLGEGLTWDLFVQVWILPVIYVAVVFLNAILSYFVLYPVSLCPKEFKLWFGLGQYISNGIALPLLVLPSVCSQIVFESSLSNPFGESTNETVRTLTQTECLITGETYLVTIVIFSQFLYWVLIFHFVEDVSNQKVVPNYTTDSSIEANAEDVAKAQKKDIEAVNDLTIVDREQAAAENGHVVLTELEQSPEEKEREVKRLKRKERKSRIYKNCVITFSEPAVISQIIGLTIGLVPALHEVFFAKGAALEPVGTAFKSTALGLAPLMNLAMSATLGLQSKEMSRSTLMSKQDELGVYQRTYALYVCGRMIILPGVNLVLFYFIQDYILPKDRLLRLILYSVLATPSANLNVVIANVTGHQKAASFLAKGALYQYITGIVTFALFLFASVIMSDV